MVRKIVWGDGVKLADTKRRKEERRKMWLCRGFPQCTNVKLKAIQASGISDSKPLKQWWLSLEVSNKS